ncbi:ATP-binding protein [Amycolatopsis sp. VS8301801F10]|uniref:ATP-binding protein n=1 Tax=Amycolatopsis sp. VS8301801F10 TaxID=2652442 RepID=UPI0038FC5BE5
MLTVVLGVGVLLVALGVATALVLRATRASTGERLPDLAWGGTARQFEWSVDRLAGLTFDMRRFESSVDMLASLQPMLADLAFRVTEPTGSGPAEVTDARIIAELNHALQTPLRGLSYAVRNLEKLSDDVLIEERVKRLADMAAMLDSCTAALATFRGLVNTVASVPSRQPSLNEAVRAFGESLSRPTDEPIAIDVVGLPDRVDGFSNHYLLTMLQPLVENAVEGCVPGGTIEIVCIDHGDAVEFTVSNPVAYPVDEAVLFSPRRTTKDGHQGLGISIVSRLAEFERGELTADITDTGVRMRVVLPRR